MQRYNIESTIVIATEDHGMQTRKVSKKRSNSHKPASKYASTAKASKQGFFHGVQSDNTGVSQTVNVDVKIEQADDGIAECLSGCFSACLGLGKKAAE